MNKINGGVKLATECSAGPLVSPEVTVESDCYPLPPQVSLLLVLSSCV